jgi:cell division protein FtsI (penicillin-binding protein 3)
MTPGIPRAARLRAYLAGAVLSLGLCGVAWRAWALQIDDNDHYRALAMRQHGANVDIPAPRGEIRDVHGEPFAVSADVDSIWANPREIRDVTATADKLASILQTDEATLEGKLGTTRKFVWLDRHVSPDVADAVRRAKLPGIEIAREPKRWYPSRSLGGSLIGRADIDGNGLDGIELAMNAHLTGTRGAGYAVRDARGRRTFADGLARPEPGGTVKLTIDRNIQAIAEGALSESVITHKAQSGVAVVIDVATGHVLGMATYPVYDPNHPKSASITNKRLAPRNRPVTDAFEAGSVMKLFTVAAALDAGVVKPDTGFDTHPMTIPGRRSAIRDTHLWPYLTTSEIIKHSSNVGAVKIAQRLGKEAFYKALLAFGFGAKSNIELPGEQTGWIRNYTRWRDVEFATMAFGYGITVTPLQLAGAIAAIGNDGIYTPPRIVDSVTSRDGSVLYHANGEPRRVVSSKTAGQLRAMMGTVFEGGKLGGTGKDITVPGFVCGGKTGTAHKWDPVAKKYAESNYLSSFIGLAPIDNPRLAIVVLVDDPDGGDYFGGKVAGPVFAKVASESLRYLGVPGATLQCPPPVPNAHLLATIPPKTCVIPAPKPGAKPKPVSDGNSPKLLAAPTPL